MEFIVIGDKPKAHKGKRITVPNPQISTNHIDGVPCTVVHSNTLISFKKESGYSKEYFVDVVEIPGDKTVMVLQPLRGNKITLQVELI